MIVATKFLCRAITFPILVFHLYFLITHFYNFHVFFITLQLTTYFISVYLYICIYTMIIVLMLDVFKKYNILIALIIVL
jgi:hypothetical protein